MTRVLLWGDNLGAPWNEGNKNTAVRYAAAAEREGARLSVATDAAVGPLPLRACGAHLAYGTGLAALRAHAAPARIVQEAPDVLHLVKMGSPLHVPRNLAQSALIRTMAKRGTGVVVSYFGEDYFRGLNASLLRRSDALVSSYVVNNRKVRDAITSRGVAPRKVHVVPPLVDTDAIRPAAVPRDGPPVIGYVGHFKPDRGLRGLLRALGALRREGADFRATLAWSGYQPGSQSREADVLRGIVAEESLGDRVELTGYSTSLPDLLAGMDVVVLPFERASAIEPPLLLLEGMAAGCVVVARRVNLMDEVVTDGVDGMLYAQDDELLPRLRRVLSGARELPANARRTAVERYSYAAHGKLLAQAYAEAGR